MGSSITSITSSITSSISTNISSSITTNISTSMKYLMITLLTVMILLNSSNAAPKPWYQGDGLPDCAPGLCPATAEISPVKCSSDPTMYFNNGYPTVCAEGFECDAAAADAGEGDPCRPAEGGDDG